MAEEEELELDVNEKKGGKKTMVMVIVGILLLNGIGVGAWMYLNGGDSTSATGEKQEVVLGPIKYLTLVPEFIVNFGPGSKVRYLQVDLQVSTRDENAFEIIRTYRPVIRNDILILLSSVKYEDLNDRAGKVALQKRLLNAINKAVVSSSHTASAESSTNEDHSGEHEEVKGPIENVYFTHFIMQ